MVVENIRLMIILQSKVIHIQSNQEVYLNHTKMMEDVNIGVLLLILNTESYQVKQKELQSGILIMVKKFIQMKIGNM